MEDSIITLKTAKLAKEKGFDEKVKNSYHKDKGTLHDNDYSDTWNSLGAISAPTQSLLQKWLREKYNIDITVMIRFASSYGVLLHKNRHTPDEIIKETIINVTPENHISGVYEEALEEGLLRVLKLIEI